VRGKKVNSCRDHLSPLPGEGSLGEEGARRVFKQKQPAQVWQNPDPEGGKKIRGGTQKRK